MTGQIRCGPILPADRDRIAEVIDSTFGDSLAAFLPERSSRLRILTAGVNPAAAIGGYLDDRLAGVIGLKTADASVFDALTSDLLRRELGSVSLRARLAIALLGRPLQPGTIRIEFVAVDAAARGRGVGQALLDAATGFACKMGATRVELHVEPANTEAQRLYQRAGFVQAEPARESFLRRTLAPQTDRRMIKELTCTTS